MDPENAPLVLDDENETNHIQAHANQPSAGRSQAQHLCSRCENELDSQSFKTTPRHLLIFGNASRLATAVLPEGGSNELTAAILFASLSLVFSMSSRVRMFIFGRRRADVCTRRYGILRACWKESGCVFKLERHLRSLMFLHQTLLLFSPPFGPM
ncbi:hypothetical protein B0H14DRAFT_2928576 [Mycena olivaceomarginata]|nr:hypothetical protein B0H14DRAFT_2928576 [Mycena olivaceomarginata]